MEKLLWLDGHVSLIDGEEATRKMVAELTDYGWVYVLHHCDAQFEWHNNMWMQI